MTVGAVVRFYVIGSGYDGVSGQGADGSARLRGAPCEWALPFERWRWRFGEPAVVLDLILVSVWPGIGALKRLVRL